MYNTVVFLLLTSPALYSQHHISRRRRFALLGNFVKEWTVSENEAPSEDVPEKYLPTKHYTIADTGYLGRPDPVISKLLRWDDRPEYLGPLLSRLVQLTKDILEETDVAQSLLLATVGMENTLVHHSEVQGEESTR